MRHEEQWRSICFTNTMRTQASRHVTSHTRKRKRKSACHSSIGIASSLQTIHSHQTTASRPPCRHLHRRTEQDQANQHSREAHHPTTRAYPSIQNKLKILYFCLPSGFSITSGKNMAAYCFRPHFRAFNTVRDFYISLYSTHIPGRLPGAKSTI